MAWIIGADTTQMGRHEGESSLSLMARAGNGALEDAGLTRDDIDGVLCGYRTSEPHPMLASVFADYYGLRPAYAHDVQLGGATGVAMATVARALCQAGQCANVLAVIGENRLTGFGADHTVKSMADAGHPDYEVPLGPTVPGFYALTASRYLYEHGLKEEDLAELGVLMRRYASRHPKAHFTCPITVDEVMASRPIAPPLKLLDCCPISDGACALVVSREAPGTRAVRIAGAGQHHPRNFTISAPSLTQVDALSAAERALRQADVSLGDVDIVGIYDSFSISLLVYLEALGFVPRGEGCAAARSGHFDADGRVPVNSHGGLMSFGHPGGGGGMAHLIEVYQQLAGKAGARQIAGRRVGLVHLDGGLFSAQATLVLTCE